MLPISTTRQAIVSNVASELKILHNSTNIIKGVQGSEKIDVKTMFSSVASQQSLADDGTQGKLEVKKSNIKIIKSKDFHH
jgi:hypothetical protein